MPDYRAMAAKAAQDNGVPVDLFLAQINKESGFQPKVTSPAGAKGIAQIMPEYHPGVDPMDPQAALNYAAHMDAQNYHKYGNWNDVLSVYNSGRPWAQGSKIGETSNYVNSILKAAQSAGGVGALQGSGNLPLASAAHPGVNGSLQSVLSNPSMPSAQQGMASLLLQAAANGGQLNPGSLLQMAAMRQAGNAAQQTYGPTPTTGSLLAQQPQTQPGSQATGSLSFIGSTQGIKSSLLNSVSQAAKAAGATQIKITSGYRDPGHNASVGGVQHSNHLTGDAIDGYGLVNGQWVPLGQLLLKTAGHFGLRSGDVPGFFNGGTDPVHVDDGANQ